MTDISFTRAPAGTKEAISSAVLLASSGTDQGTVVLDLTGLFADFVTSLTRSWALEKSGRAAARDALMVTISTETAEALWESLSRAIDDAS